MHRRTKALHILGIVLTTYALLVATHRGEFWPFSIYPMFSQAGTPWTRSIVRTMPDGPPASWTATSLGHLPGVPFPVERRGINQNDVSNFVSKTAQWTPRRLRGLRSIFASSSDFSPPLLVMRVRGRLAGDSVSVQATPLIYFDPDSTRLNPTLPRAPAPPHSPTGSGAPDQ